jgi:hypothetical protein
LLVLVLARKSARLSEEEAQPLRCGAEVGLWLWCVRLMCQELLLLLISASAAVTLGMPFVVCCQAETNKQNDNATMPLWLYHYYT